MCRFPLSYMDGIVSDVAISTRSTHQHSDSIIPSHPFTLEPVAGRAYFACLRYNPLPRSRYGSCWENMRTKAQPHVPESNPKSKPKGNSLVQPKDTKMAEIWTNRPSKGDGRDSNVNSEILSRGVGVMKREAKLTSQACALNKLKRLKPRINISICLPIAMHIAGYSAKSYKGSRITFGNLMHLVIGLINGTVGNRYFRIAKVEMEIQMVGKRTGLIYQPRTEGVQNSYVIAVLGVISRIHSRRALLTSKTFCGQGSFIDLAQKCRFMATGNSGVGVGGTNEANAYCRELVRKHDYESHLCSYFYPRAAQPGYFALRAFNDRPMKHPIAIALHEASQNAKLSPYYLKRMVDEEDLDRESHTTLEGVTQYAESTSSTLLYLLLGLLHQNHSDTLAHAASHIGVASSLATLLRALPFHAANRRMIIPVEITAKHGVRHEEVFRTGGGAQGIDDAVFEFATVANDHILTARDAFKDSGVPSQAMPVFLSAVPVASFLSRLEQVNFDAFAPQLQTKSWRLPLGIWRASRTRKF
ncbi:squalene/phytoene synthase domain-containing protein [Rhizoctonia solani AG-1 IA]|uniref:Squalene/phytoene synthase domain-containing protein n=1 Tax=Thanatephorus cucumeris (strain AG1-IA) TaxID=983506 RepID=L8WRK0_THACA|nr:squalene/phytoene synthase domain-containing protein [Rhizoctonia solani AG-1 IA]